MINLILLLACKTVWPSCYWTIPSFQLNYILIISKIILILPFYYSNKKKFFWLTTMAITYYQNPLPILLPLPPLSSNNKWNMVLDCMRNVFGAPENP